MPDKKTNRRIDSSRDILFCKLLKPAFFIHILNIPHFSNNHIYSKTPEIRANVQPGDLTK